jgi:hypothetical protein
MNCSEETREYNEDGATVLATTPERSSERRHTTDTKCPPVHHHSIT